MDLRDYRGVELVRQIANLPLALAHATARLHHRASAELHLLSLGQKFLALLQLLASTAHLRVKDGCLLRVQSRVLEEGFVETVLVHQHAAVLGQEVELRRLTRQILHLRHVNTIISVERLDNRSVAVTHRVVVLDGQVLQVLDDAVLQVARTRRLHGGIHQSLTTRHAVEEVLLGTNTREETIRHPSSRTRHGIVGAERRKRLSRNHHGDTTTLQLLLAQSARDLSLVHIRSLGSRCNHTREGVVWEGDQQSVRQTHLKDLRGNGRHDALHHVIHLRTHATATVDVASAQLLRH